MSVILCIDDEPLLRKCLTDELHKAGHQTVEAENGEEGLTSILNHSPDLVICDVNMPRMNGYELLTQLRSSNPQFSELPFLFLSSDGDREMVIAGKKTADDYITKPIDFDLLNATISSRLKRASQAKINKRSELAAYQETILRVFPHELRTPLNHILGFSEILMTETLGPINNAQYVEYARHIHDGGQKLLETINKVLDLVDILSGNITPVFDTLNLETIIDGCVEAIRSKAEESNISLAITTGEIPQKFASDPDLLGQALSILLRNAVKFSDEKTEISIQATYVEPCSVEITVTDTGIGITAKDIERIFTPFGQVDKGLSRTYEGIGLGLTRAKAIVNILGGELTVESEVNAGSKFIIRIPGRHIASKEIPAGRL